MSDKPKETRTSAKTEAAKEDAEADAAVAETAATGGTVTLQHVAKGDWTLTVGDTTYQVTAGAVQVAAADVEAAYQAGFRPLS